MPHVETFHGPALHAAVNRALNLAYTARTRSDDLAAIAALTDIGASERPYAAWAVLGRLYSRTGQSDKAAAAYRAASILEPTNADALCNATWGARDDDRETEAINTLRCALRIDPDLAEAWHNLGAALRNTGDLELALACLYEARARWDDAMTDVGIGEVATALGLLHDAIHTTTSVIARTEPADPNNIDARFSRGLAHLALGQLRPGWEDYEARLERPNFQSMIPTNVPAWDGSACDSGRVLVWREQGIGDEIRFLSCLPDLIADTPSVVVQCSPRLAEIVRRSFPADVVSEAVQVPRDVTAHVPMGSLMRAYRPTIASFPGAAHLTADPDRVAFWRDALAALGSAPKVGLSWRSRLLTNRRTLHYPEPESLRALTALEDVQLIDLQYDHQPAELRALAEDFGVRVHHFPELDLKNDLDEVFALCTALDAVVSVGNAVSEIAGAVGTPTFEVGLMHTPFAFGRNRSAWHRRTTFITKTWAEPWSVATQAATDAVQAHLDQPSTTKELP